MSNFIHLHVHSDYSALDGACTLTKIIDKVKHLGQSAVALTEHGNIDSAFKFSLKCQEAGIKPIHGCEMYFAPLGIAVKDSTNPIMHIVVLCKNEIGWQNLLQLIAIANTDGFYYKPRVDFELLEKYHEGLIILTACLQGPIAYHLRKNEELKATEMLIKFKNIFGGDFYIEVMNHGIPDQQIVLSQLYNIAEVNQVKAVATNDVHYITKEDWEVQELLICENMKHAYYDRVDKRNPQEFYLKTRDQMEVFIPNTNSLDTTLEIADKCTLLLKKSSYILPTTKEFEFDVYVREGKRRYHELFTKQEYVDRLDKEIEVIKAANLAGYFVTVYDFVRYAKANGVAVGPGRGSAGGSLLAYILGITAIDPIKYNLLFSRFYNAGRRESLPDIDIDFSSKNINKVFTYIEEKYGRDNICQIGTVNTYAPKGALKAICRTFQVPFQQANEMTSLIDSKAKSLKIELDDNEQVKEKYYNDSTPYSRSMTFRDIYNYAMKLEGLVSHKGVHAAGIVISPVPLRTKIPLRRDKNAQLLVSCWTMDDLESNGLVKFDFLRLDNLDAIEETLQQIGKTIKDIPIDTDSKECQKMYRVLTKTGNVGIFQLSSNEGSKIINRLQPKDMEALAVGITLNRPGCINSGLHEEYLLRKAGKNEITYPHPILEPILKDTYGVMIYQEQIIKICMVMAGFTESEADIVRKAMGKKKDKLMTSMKEKFIDGSIKNGIDKKKADEIWSLIKQFSEYSFNKCIDGDCYIDRDNKARNRYTIKEMYNLKTYWQNYSHSKQKAIASKYRNKGYGKARNLIGERIFTDHIRDIYYQGQQPVYQITLENGQTITATNNHQFPVFAPSHAIIKKQLVNIEVGEYLFIIGQYEKTTTKYPLSKSGIQQTKGKTYDGEGFPEGETNPGYIDGNYIEFEYVKNELKHIINCQLCGNFHKRLEHHHINGHRHDNRKENIIKICPSCHKKEEYKQGRKRKFSKGLLSSISKIVSIEYIGYKDVYDIEMENEPHNLFINGIATYNSHAIGYAHIAYYCAYLKANYTTEYMCSLLNTAVTDQDKLMLYLNECRRIKIKIKLPNINESGLNFIGKKKSILYGLMGVKGLGEETVQNIIKNRPYVDLFDFVMKTGCGSGGLTLLAYAGALDGFGYTRKAIVSNAEIIIKKSKLYTKKNLSPVPKLFDIKPDFTVTNIDEYSLDDLLAYEYDVLQAYVSQNPLERYFDWIEKNITDREWGDEHTAIAGYVQTKEEKISKAGNSYMDVTLYTPTKTQRVLFFKAAYRNAKGLLDSHKAIWIKGLQKEDVILADSMGLLTENNI